MTALCNRPYADLGLVSSNDQGKSWGAVSLTGTTDFHDLEISHSSQGATTIYGFDSADCHSGEPQGGIDRDVGRRSGDVGETFARSLFGSP